MKALKRRVISVAVTMCLIMAQIPLTACTNGNMQLAASDASTLIYGSGDYTSINPALYEHGEINSLLFLGLTTHDKDNLVVPGLAESWSWDASSKSYNFQLRENLTFHDGHALTSADVKFTFEAILDSTNLSENYSNYTDIVSIETPDELHVVFKLSAPNVAMLDYLSMGILPKHLLAGEDLLGNEFNQSPVGAGPYRLVDWDLGQSITMERFESFCLGTANIERVIFKIVPDVNARALQLKTGELDLAQLTPKDAEQFQEQQAFTLYDMETADYRAILYNFNHALWRDNPGLPTALSYAIDREAIVSAVLLGQGEVAYSPLQKSAYSDANIEKYTYDPARAKREIEVLGWQMQADGYYQKDGVQLAFSIVAPPSDQVRVDMASICAQNLRDIGVNASVETPAKTDWAGQSSYLIGWGSPFDPDDHTYKVFATDQAANYGNYSNAQVDKALLGARITDDVRQRTQLYQHFQAELAKDPAYTFIAYLDAVYVSQIGLEGISTDNVLGHHGVGIFWNVWQWSKR